MSSRVAVPIDFGDLDERGRQFPPKLFGKSSPNGWGVRLIPAHCHSQLRRVERYRDRRHAVLTAPSLFPGFLPPNGRLWTSLLLRAR